MPTDDERKRALVDPADLEAPSGSIPPAVLHLHDKINKELDRLKGAEPVLHPSWDLHPARYIDAERVLNTLVNTEPQTRMPWLPNGYRWSVRPAARWDWPEGQHRTVAGHRVDVALEKRAVFGWRTLERSDIHLGKDEPAMRRWIIFYAAHTMASKWELSRTRYDVFLRREADLKALYGTYPRKALPGVEKEESA